MSADDKGVVTEIREDEAEKFLGPVVGGDMRTVDPDDRFDLSEAIGSGPIFVLILCYRPSIRAYLAFPA